MTPEQHARVKALFLSACEMSPAERRALLDRECAGDPDVRAEVEGLLGHDSDPHESLKTPALGVALTTMLGRALGPSAPTELPERVGPYRVVRLLGVGGMGIVYVAEQDRPRRTVALKVMQAGPGAASLLRRFEHEAELLGRLRHPGIAQIYESGLAGEGALARPYIAMELVEGRPLTEAVAKLSLATRQRVELMVRVCEAVQHAHQRGVIHRDLKPANIMVDESGQPKVLDFGVARATDADLLLTSMNTGMGQMVGTLPYMSPEQVAGDPREIDTRSDVYALGVILYQVLTGRLPYDPSGRSMPELARLIRDESPARMSSIDRTLRGDLDTIVWKAMEKDKPRRYQSAASLGDDLRRYLSGEPIAAKGDSALYAIGKQLRRHKGPVGAGVAALIGLVVFAVYASVQARANKVLAREADAALGVARASESRAEAELEYANIQRGRMAVQAGSTPGAEELLWPAFLRDPDSAAARWALWEFCCRFGHRAIAHAHDGASRTCVVSPDGRVVYTGGNDGAVRAWNAVSLAPIAQDVGERSEVWAMRASPDGRIVVAVGSDPVLRVLDPASLERIASPPVDGARARSLAFSPDSSRLYTGHVDGSVSAWDARTWERLWSHRPHGVAVVCVEVSPDGWPIATGDLRGVACLWDGPGGPSRTWRAHGDELASMAFVEGGRLVTGGNDERARVWDVASGEQLGELLAPNGSVRDLAVTPSGRTLLSSGWWGVLTWDLSTYERTHTLSMPSTVFEVAVSPDGRLGYAVMENGTLRSWRIGHGPEVLRLPGHVGRTVGAISPDGSYIATGDAVGMLRVWDGRDGRLLREIRGHPTRIRTLVIHPSGRWIGTSNESQFTMWSADSLEPAWDPRPSFTLSHSAAAFSPEGGTVAVFGRNYRVMLLDVATGAMIREFETSRQEPVSLRFSPDGAGLVVVHRGSFAGVFDPDTGDRRALLPVGDRLVWSCDFSPDGSLMAIGDWGRELTIWNTRDWSIRHVLTGHAGLIYDVGFNPTNDGTVATAGADGTVRLWDAQEGRSLLTLDRFEGWTAHSASFDPAGTRLLSCNSHNGEVVVWDLRYYDADIAMHVEHEIGRRAASMGDRLRADRARAWAARVRARAVEPGGEGSP